MATFRAIVFAASLSGLLVGLAVSVLQHFGTVPLIQRSEVFEKAAAKPPEPAAAAHRHEGADVHEHARDAWEPGEGLERNAYTVLFNVVDWVGFGLLLAGAIVLVGRPADWRDGLLWGLAGFATFVVAPTLGLPPELPGVPAAPLGPRQVWWIATAAATAAGLGLIAFRRSPLTAAAGVVLMTLPHLVGAPTLGHVETNVPHELSHRFAVAVVVTAFVSWALLGGLTGFFYRRFSA